MNIYDIGIIGAGVAGAFAALKISQINPSLKTIIFDLGRPPGKRRRQLEGWLGCFPAGDGKLYPADIDKINSITNKSNTKNASWIINTFGEVGTTKLLKNNYPSQSIQKKFANSNFELKLNNYFQWKPESIHQLSKFISESLDKSKNITFSFDNEVFRISKNKDIFCINSSSGDFYCKKLIFCVGRSGWRWADKIYRDLGLIQNNNYARFGVRVELSASQMKEFNRSHCSFYRNELEIGPLSWQGTVIPEDHVDLVIANFRSNEDRWKSDKVSFSITTSQYFENTGTFQTERLGKLAFLLFNDRVSKEKIKLFMNGNSQLCYLPEYNWLNGVMEELNEMIPNIISRGYFHLPNIVPVVANINLNSKLESEIEGFYVAGESAGVMGILAAAFSGTICAENACK